MTPPAHPSQRLGRYEVTAVGGERVRAFVPSPLPPVPGGDRFLAGRMAGVGAPHPQLHGPNENFWQVISARFQVHCKLQLLYDCHCFPTDYHKKDNRTEDRQSSWRLLLQISMKNCHQRPQMALPRKNHH